MKIAIIQEWLVTVGGSDKVVKAIADVFPAADIYTLVAKKQVCDELGIDWNKVHTSFIQKLPLGVKKHRMYLPIFPFAIEQFDLRGYDVIISSSHAVAKGVITKADQLHICYCHSPIRYVWDMYHEYLEESGLTKGLKGYLAKYMLHRIRISVISPFLIIVIRTVDLHQLAHPSDAQFVFLYNLYCICFFISV